MVRIQPLQPLFEGSPMADHSIPDQIALEIMDTIEREKRINRDDLRMAVERVLQRADRWLPPVMVRPNDVTGWDWAPGGVEWVPALTDYERYVADQRKDMRQAKSKREMQAAYKMAEIQRASLWGKAEFEVANEKCAARIVKMAKDAAAAKPRK